MAAPTKFLQKLANGIEKSKVVVIQESSDCRGEQLFQSLIKSWSRVPESNNTLVLLQNFPTHYDGQKVAIVDVLGQLNDITKEQNYTDRIKEQLSNLNGGKLFIDTIDPLIVGDEFDQVEQLFKWLTSKFDSIVAVLNGSLASESIEHSMKRWSTTFIHLNHVPSMSVIVAKIINKKKHRRVDFVLEFFDENILIDSNFNLITVDTIKPDLNPIVPSGDILPGVTFNLSLRDEERIAKESLVLPYIKNRPESINTESRVYYYPDQNDDVDEDDPDDDLGI